MSIGPSADATSGFDGLEVVTDDIMARSDAELLAASRTGDQLAYGELFRRHAPAATALARRLTGHPSDADDLVSEAFTKVLSALKNGSGPTSAMRPYLLTAVRRVHVDKAVAGQRVQPTDDIGAHDPGVPFVDPALADLERSMVAQAYQQLPERWQMVLWHTEVEELSPRDIAPLLGMSPNAVAALALRARAGLREAYLAAHISSTATAECQRLLPKLAAYVRGSAAARERAAVERHLPDCEDCRAVLVELQDVGGRMRAVVAPLVLGLGASGYLADIALLPKLALPMAKIGAVGHGAGVVAGPPAPTGASGATGGGGGAGGGGASGAAGWAVAALAALIVAGAVISAIALSHNDGPADQAGRPASASQSANQPGDSNSAPTPPGATAPPPPLGPTAGGSNSPKPLSERTGSGRTPTAAAVAPSASTPVPTAPPTAAKTSAPTYVPPEPSTTTPTTPPTSPSTTPTDPTSTTSTTTTPPPPPPDAPTPSSLTAGDFVSGGNGLISVSLSEVAAVTTTVTVTLPVPLSSTAAGCAPDASGATVCTLTIVPGTDFVSLPVQVGAVDATTTVEVPMVVSGEGLTAKTGTSQVVIEPGGT
jgi:RNA polymerase sigma factor (sigma-70 family)